MSSGLAKKEHEIIELVLSSKLMLDQAQSGDWDAVARTESIRRQELEQYFRDHVPATCRQAVAQALQDILTLNARIEALISGSRDALDEELGRAVKKARASRAYQSQV